MKKILKYLKRTVIVIVSVCLILVGGVFIGGKIGRSRDLKRMEDYGEKVEVFDKKMNLYITGEGSETIVLLPGYGTIAPKLSFEPIIEKMKDDYRIVLVEPFGYGMSDETDRERTLENIVEDIHVALQAKGIDDFIFMGHSIAGIYMLTYTNLYPNEAKAFIGIDTSVPDQPMAGMDTKSLRMMDSMGILQLAMTKPFGYPDVPAFIEGDDILQYVYHTRTKSLNSTMLNEMDEISNNFNKSKAYALPKDLPVYLFAQEDNKEIPTWATLHEEQKNSVENGKLMLIDGDHFLHYEHSEIIVKETKAFLDEILNK